MYKRSDFLACIEAYKMLFGSFSNHAGITWIVEFMPASAHADITSKRGILKIFTKPVLRCSLSV